MPNGRWRLHRATGIEGRVIHGAWRLRVSPNDGHRPADAFGAGWRCRTSRNGGAIRRSNSRLVSEDLDHPAMDQFIVTRGDRPFAYLQCYDPTAWPDNGLGEHPAGTRGIDQFIGETDMIGRGHGSALHPHVCRRPAAKPARRAS